VWGPGVRGSRKQDCDFLISVGIEMIFRDAGYLNNSAPCHLMWMIELANVCSLAVVFLCTASKHYSPVGKTDNSEN
jgi:hypothetical protein